MKTIAIVLLVAALALAQKHPQSYWFDGLWQGYDGEWTHVTRQVMALAEATPAEKYAWRPAPGVRTFSEVYMHIAVANYWLLSVTGPKPPEGFSPDLEKTVTQKAEVLDWLKRSFEAVRTERAKLHPADLARKVKNGQYDATVDGMYLRIIVHANEHMGQAVAYARTAGFAPPWAKGGE
jgi:uncharacterized damage-inducible protein DinB